MVVYTCWKKQAHEQWIFNPDPTFSFLGHKLIPVTYVLVWLKNWTESQLQQLTPRYFVAIDKSIDILPCW